MSNEPVYRVLIFCANPEKLEGVARFLVNRGWQAQVEKSLKRMIEVILRYQPDLVLMTVNHPQVNADKLYPMIQQHGIRALPFAEESDPRTYTRLQAYPQNTVIYPPISGPSVYRKIQLLIKSEEDEIRDMERRHQEEMDRRRLAEIGSSIREENSPPFQVQSQNEVLSQSGSASGPTFFSMDNPNGHSLGQGAKESKIGPGAGQGASQTPSFFSTPETSDSSSLGTSSSDAEDSFFAPAPDGQIEDLDAVQRALAEQTPPAMENNPQVDRWGFSQRSALPQESRDEMFAELFDAPSTGGAYNDPFADMFALPQHNGPQGQTAKDLPAKAQSIQPAPTSAPHNYHESAETTSSAQRMPDSKQREALVLTPPRTTTGDEGSESQHSSLRGVQEHIQERANLTGGALERRSVLSEAGGATALSLKQTSDQDLGAVADASRKTLIESSDFAGPTERRASEAQYLDAYAVKGKKKKGVVLLSDHDGTRSEQESFADFGQRLAEHLRSSGEDVDEIERLQVKLDAASINDVVDSAGEFAYSSLHSGEEVLLTYLAGDDLVPELVEAQQDMLSVPIDGFVPDQEVDFEVFLYLANNKKFYKYLRPGRSLSAKQIDKLKNASMAHLFVRNSDANKAKGHHLKNKIEGLPQSSAKKKKAG